MTPGQLPPREIRLLALVLAMLALAAVGPHVAQSPHYHAFADQQPFWGLPHAWNVLSNLPFGLAGAACLVGTARLGPRALSATERVLLTLTGMGLLLTALGSAWYHLAPGDAGLLVDRGAMLVPFAGLLGLAGCRISSRAGRALAVTVLVAGPVALNVCAATGNLFPWSVLQGGGLLMLLMLWGLRNETALPVRWGLVVATYAVAKLFEAGDHLVWSLSGELVSGHALKHAVAALAVLPVLGALERLRRGGQNGRQLPPRAADPRRSLA
ncbi:MAG TPA: hypothetical protein VFE82_01160 [Ramlibacter sp.]|uniref:hypothetical protein n=1 Tax=Ramlibacter sp. TaxID=1917967 RepID=UPI002D363752|nr:hypothetical protein [Ramlibacter sp.]HZY17054.1 hypothetical protein [Ramlibacter sp.]